MTTSYCLAQDHYLPIRDYEDMGIIDKLMKDYHLYNSILYKPINNDKYTSILLINNGNDINYWCIRNDSIFKNGCLKSSTIFQYCDYKKTGAIIAERYTSKTFVPPIIMSGINSEGIIYRDSKIEFYFEYGENVTSYKESPKRAKYRKEWLEIIRGELKLKGIF